MPLKMTNNATSLLSSPLGNNPATDLTVSITAGDEGKFPTLGVGDWHPITVTKSTGEREVMRIVGRSGVNLQVAATNGGGAGGTGRGAEGTTPLSFAVGDARVDVRLTGAALNEIAIHDKILSVPADLSTGFRTTPNRFVWNDKLDLSGTDIMSLNETGALTVTGTITSAAYFLSSGTSTVLGPTAAGTIYLQPGGYGSGAGQFWINSTAAAFAGSLTVSGMLYASGGITIAGALDLADVSVDTLTIAGRADGYSILLMSKDAGAHANQIRGRNGAEERWIMQLGDTVAESGSAYVGSNFNLIRYNNAGAAGDTVFQIIRDTGMANFYRGLTVNGGISCNTTITAVQNFVSSTVNVVVAPTVPANAVGTVFLRPGGPNSGTNQTTVDNSGNMNVNGFIQSLPAAGGEVYAGQGIRCKTTANATTYQTSHANLSWDGTWPCLSIDNTLWRVTGIVACDYRIKQDVRLLDSAWEQIKTLKPISYTRRDYEIIKADGLERYGFLAHELAETLPTIAVGDKDGEFLQSVDLLPVVAMLTKALQEAQLRIEALEKRLG
jgi:hypothetical protein